VDENLLHIPGQAIAPATDLQQAAGLDEHSLTGDAMFVDPAKGDFTVKDGSPALKLGFKNIPMDQFGVQSPKLKALAKTPPFTAPASMKEAKGSKSNRDPKVVAWEGARIKNVIGLDEVSEAGLNDEIGVKVVEAPAGSNAAKAGLQAGDVILKCNGKGTKSVADFLKLWKTSWDGNQLQVWRDQKGMNLTYRIPNP
jgi:hypothetical protein